MKIVITGALGHIGSKLIRYLPEKFEGSELILIDNFLTQRYCSLFNLPKGDRKFVEADILFDDLQSLFIGASVVVHLAARTDATSSFEKKDDVELVNFVGSERVALACGETKVPLIALSTTSVYGTQKSIVDESCPFFELKPQTPYAESKLKMENRLMELGRTNELQFTICRFGTIFGTSPGMRFHTAVNKFVWQACMGLPVTVWRTAINQYRPYLDLDDACRAIGFIIENKMFDNNIFNVLTLNATVGDIVTVIRNYIPSLQIKFVDECIMNQLSYKVSCDKFTDKGFNFTGNLDERVKESIKMLDICGEIIV
jgi:nucleoside-diphosphate-sugar epimerase